MILFLIGIVFCVTVIFAKQKYFWIGLSVLIYSFYFNVVEFRWFPFILTYNLASFLAFVIFMVGVILMVLDIYLPDFGVTGVLGLIISGTGLYLYLDNWLTVLFLMIAGFLVVVVTGFIYLRLGQEIAISPALILHQSLDKQSGYLSRNNYEALLGKKGQVTVDLRPVGKGLIDQQEYELMSIGDYIIKGAWVTVVKVSNGSIYVRQEEKV